MNRTAHRLVAVILAVALTPSIAGWTTASRTKPVSAERFEGIGARGRLAQVLALVDQSNAPNLIGGSRWRALVKRHREDIGKAASHAEFRDAVNALFEGSEVSHFHYYTDEDWSYWHLGAAFSRGEPGNQVEHSGVFPQQIDGRWFVRGILEGSVAAATRMRVGDELVSVDGEPFSPVRVFRGKAGTSIRLKLCRRPGLTYGVTVTPVRESLHEALQRAIQESIRVIEHDGFRMAYVHGWTLLGRGTEYRSLLEMQRDVDGLIIDYRDGFGGMPQAASRFLLGDRARQGAANTTPFWTKPVVILTADGTRSAKEIVVRAVKDQQRAPLIGSPTPGSVTTVGGIRRIGEDGLLMLPGHRLSLEGDPTHPHFFMDRDIRYGAGRDAQLAWAKDILTEYICLTPVRMKDEG